jgi:Ca2+-binding RTX toxin-like protein
LNGTLGGDELIGGSGRDHLVGASGNDRLFGGFDRVRDVLVGAGGHDVCFVRPQDRAVKCAVIRKQSGNSLP